MAAVVHDLTGMSRAQRRRMEKLAEQVDRVTRGDARFFERRPERNHRIRILSRPERETLEITGGLDASITPPGEEWVAIVRQVRPGARIRRFLRVVKGGDLDQPEGVCRDLFERVTGDSPRAREIEAAISNAMEDRPHG